MSKNSPNILAISSTVAVGHVGLSAIVPTLHLVGMTAAALPTVTLSNHPGFPHAAGTQVDAKILASIVDAFDQNGWLSQFSTILTGYLPSPAHVAFAAATVNRIRAINPDVRVICDPILGDDPKGLYTDQAAAIAIREDLIPLADTVLPNRFELSWLTTHPVTSPQEAIAAARSLPATQTIAKSIPIGADHICNIDVRHDSVTAVTVRLVSGVPNGTGDMFSGLIAADWPLARATAALSAVINASLSQDHLSIIPAVDQWRDAAPLPTTSAP